MLRKPSPGLHAAEALRYCSARRRAKLFAAATNPDEDQAPFCASSGSQNLVRHAVAMIRSICGALHQLRARASASSALPISGPAESGGSRALRFAATRARELALRTLDKLFAIFRNGVRRRLARVALCCASFDSAGAFDFVRESRRGPSRYRSRSTARLGARARNHRVSGCARAPPPKSRVRPTNGAALACCRRRSSPRRRHASSSGTSSSVHLCKAAPAYSIGESARAFARAYRRALFAHVAVARHHGFVTSPREVRDRASISLANPATIAVTIVRRRRAATLAKFLR